MLECIMEQIKDLKMGTMAKDQVLTVFCFFRPTYLNCDRTYHFEYLFVPLIETH